MGEIGMLDRRAMMLSGCAMLAAGATGALRAASAARSPFVRVDGLRFVRNGRTYRFAGANMWYGAYLGAPTPYGNRDRLMRELDRLQALGVTNLRVLASAEESPLRNSITPGFRDRSDRYNRDLLAGLDFLLAEMAKRGMVAVLYLTNFWEWSGGMATYLYWVNGGHFINMNDPAHPWPEFADRNSAFYGNAQAVALYHAYVRAVVGRTNSITGKAYRDDPTIMAWQLANEPRPGGGVAAAEAAMPAFQRWVEDTARLIKAVDPNHLVSTGSEGLKGCIEREACVVDEHGAPIDYLTAHIWPLNWGWVDDADLPSTHEAGRARVAAYIADHIRIARDLHKPLVIEEFGYPRDGGAKRYDPAAGTAWRDRYYNQIYDAVLADARAGGPLAGSNFWAWNGEGRAQHPDHLFQRGDLSYLGDPPHEPQGWYGVFDSDSSTLATIRAHSAALKAVG
jgi:mannan endo-1,4-beta-mannosidase